jgi:hypothetical protein
LFTSAAAEHSTCLPAVLPDAHRGLNGRLIDLYDRIVLA